MHTSDLYLAVHWTARASALLFAAALVAPALFRSSGQRSQGFYLGFILAHTIHFMFVIGLVRATGGANMFPGGRSVADVGGWPAVFGIFALFYALAFIAFAARRMGTRARSTLRVAGRLSTLFLGYMFVSTYVPLVSRSRWYALPAAIVATAVLVDASGRRLRREPTHESGAHTRAGCAL
ncbi:hypothetical protein WME73_10820 [Sorangium sp. So ce302]|uniref:hypothetical protein n=1 Tax=Sorangium sp. So ce302 TaxID=3133297 RepID=UPI003F62E540